jgi:hypothetical protein
VDPCLRALLTQTINVRRVTAYTSGGNETLGTATAVRAHVEVKDAEGPSPGGTEATVSHLLITETAIGRDDVVWLPGLDPTNAALGKHPIAVDTFRDERGNVDHYEVTL